MADLARKFFKLTARWAIPRQRECNVCGGHSAFFLPYRGGWRAMPSLMRELRMVGSDPDHFECARCGSTDRERHLLAYMRASGVWDGMSGKALLQFAPEARLTPLLSSAGLAKHVRGDLYPQEPAVEKIDMLGIPYADASFDLVMANHVLEHVDDDLAALRELYRVLKPGGLAILQTPYCQLLHRTISDPGVTEPGQRLQLYGQEDHTRLYGRDIFDRFTSVGFVSRVSRHGDLLSGLDPVRHGMNVEEPFFLFERLSGGGVDVA